MAAEAGEHDIQTNGVPVAAPAELVFHALDVDKPLKFRVPPEMSPDGSAVAVAVNKEVTVYSTANLEVTCKVLRPTAVSGVYWSEDALFLAITSVERSAVQVICPAQPEWGCTVSEGAAGLQQALWVPAQHTLMTIPDFSLHTSVWHIHSGSSQALPGAKHLSGCVAFARGADGGGQWAALLSRQHGKDMLHWYDTAQTASSLSDVAQDELWCSPSEQGTAETLGTTDAARLLMAPRGHSVWVIDDPMHAYAEEWAMDGTCLHKLSLRVPGLGIASATAHLSRQGGLLVLPTHSGPVHVVNALSHDKLLVANDPKTGGVLSYARTDVFVEVSSTCPDSACSQLAGDVSSTKRTSAVQLDKWRQQAYSSGNSADSRFLCAEVDVQLPQLLPSVVNETSPPRLGAVAHCSTSADEGLLALVCASRPSTVCVYETAGGSAAAPVAALCLRGTVSSVAWDPECSRLLVATASSNVLVWEPGRAYAIQSQMGRAQAAVVRSITPPPTPGAPWLLASRGRWCTARMTSSAGEPGVSVEDGDKE